MMKSDIRSTWSAEHGWRIDSPSALNARQKEAIRAYLLKVQIGRLPGLSVGPIKDECHRTIRDLDPTTGRLFVNLTQGRDGREAFQSTERMQPTAYSFPTN